MGGFLLIEDLQMARSPSATDFIVPVKGIGNFTFAYRTMGEEMKLQVEYARMIDGVTPTEWLSTVCGWIATLRTLTVRAPEGWDIDEMDPLDDDSYAKIMMVHAALRAKEGSFRRKPDVASPASGQGDVENGGVLVPPEVPADPA